MSGSAIVDVSPPDFQKSSASGPKFSVSFSGSKKTLLQTRKRPHAVLEDETQDQEDDGRHEIDVFGRSSIVTAKVERVIQSVQDTDWKDRRKRQKSGLPVDTQPHHTSSEDTSNIQERMKQGGLTMITPTNDASGTLVPILQVDVQNIARTKTIEEEALDALTGNTRPSARTILVSSEEEAFHDSFDAAPSAPTLSDFKATPVDGFGTALLRGYLKQGRTLEDYGYDENSTSSEVKKRPAGLGLGAKESGIPETEIGAWGKAAKRKGGEGYIPLAMKSKKTGEVVSQEELKMKLKQQKERERMEKYLTNTEDTRRSQDEARDSGWKRCRGDYSNSKSQYDGDDGNGAGRKDKDRRSRHHRDERRRDGFAHSREDWRTREDGVHRSRAYDGDRSRQRARSKDFERDYYRSSRRRE